MPYPADYGGVIDIFYRIKALHSLGVEIHLHCFQYGRTIQNELDKYCKSVRYYERKTGILQLSTSKPYICKSRTSQDLEDHILREPAPLLLEGIHCCALLENEQIKSLPTAIRMHNIEWSYYNQLANLESNLMRKLYFKFESSRLIKYEPIVLAADKIFTISVNDQVYFKKQYPNLASELIPAFHGNDHITSKLGKGKQIIYHGNLSVAENHNAIVEIIKNLHRKWYSKLVILGKNPKQSLHKLCKTNNITLIKNPTDIELKEQLQNAQIHLLYTKQESGLKLKLLNSLFKGRFCICNDKMLQGSNLEGACLIFKDWEEMNALVAEYSSKALTERHLAIRSEDLYYYDNITNAKKVLEWLYTQ